MNKKKIILFCFALIILPAYLYGVKGGMHPEVPGYRSIVIYSVYNNSWVSLSGTTNVNAFRCVSGMAKSTNDLIITAVYDHDRIMLSDADIIVDIGSFDCRNPLINRDMYKAMGGGQNSAVMIRILEVKLHDEMSGSTEGTVTANIDIIINGRSKRKELDIAWLREDGLKYRFKGSAELLMSDFMIDPPSPVMGLVRVDDKIKIDFNYIVRSDRIVRLD